MANKQNMKKVNYSSDIPESLDNHIFYGLTLDDEQKIFRDAIWNKNKIAVVCNAKAGTGKTTIAVAVANLMYHYGMYDGIVYIVSPVMEQRQGFLPGSEDAKNAPYMQPLVDALLTIGEDPMKVITNDMIASKNGAYVKFTADTFLRGCNIENKIVIVEEAQNFYGDLLKKTLTRIHDSCKVIIIGHDKQCDLIKNPERSGFVKYLRAFENCNDDRIQICELNTNHRGWFSTFCDDVEI